MTPEGFAALAEACDLSGFPAPGLAIRSRREDSLDGIYLTASLPVRDVNGGAVTTVYYSTFLKLGIVETMEVREAKFLIRRTLTNVICHELDENIRWGSERPFDPHADERTG